MSNLNDLVSNRQPEALGAVGVLESPTTSVGLTTASVLQTAQPSPVTYLPDFIEYSDNIRNSQIRLLILGKPGFGKTWSALTAPNPVVVDWDRGMLAFKDAKIPTLPFYDTEFCKKLNSGKPVPLLCFMDWLTNKGTKGNAFKLTKEQTLIIDSWSGFQDFENMETDANPRSTLKGKEDGFFKWAEKLRIATEVAVALTRLSCNVIITAHESEIRDEKGNELSTVMPLMQGSFQAKMGNYFTHIVRMKIDSKAVKDASGNIISVNNTWWWQVQADESFAPKCRGKVNKYKVPANWKELPV